MAGISWDKLESTGRQWKLPESGGFCLDLKGFAGHAGGRAFIQIGIRDLRRADDERPPLQYATI